MQVALFLFQVDTLSLIPNGQRRKRLFVGGSSLLTGPVVILTLKIAVAAVTLLLLLSLLVLWRGNYWLHGRINIVFFTLTLVTVLGFETIIHIIDPSIFSYIEHHPELSR